MDAYFHHGLALFKAPQSHRLLYLIGDGSQGMSEDWPRTNAGARIPWLRKGEKANITPSVGIAVLSYLFLLRACHHEITPGQSGSMFQLQHTLQLRSMANQVEHDVKVRLAKGRKTLREKPCTVYRVEFWRKLDR